jgi:hypothetical protein
MHRPCGFWNLDNRFNTKPDCDVVRFGQARMTAADTAAVKLNCIASCKLCPGKEKTNAQLTHAAKQATKQGILSSSSETLDAKLQKVEKKLRQHAHKK